MPLRSLLALDPIFAPDVPAPSPAPSCLPLSGGARGAAGAPAPWSHLPFVPAPSGGRILLSGSSRPSSASNRADIMSPTCDMTTRIRSPKAPPSSEAGASTPTAYVDRGGDRRPASPGAEENLRGEAAPRLSSADLISRLSSAISCRSSLSSARIRSFSRCRREASPELVRPPSSSKTVRMELAASFRDFTYVPLRLPDFWATSRMTVKSAAILF